MPWLGPLKLYRTLTISLAEKACEVTLEYLSASFGARANGLQGERLTADAPKMESLEAGPMLLIHYMKIRSKVQ